MSKPTSRAVGFSPTRLVSSLRRNGPLLKSSVSLSTSTGLAAFGGFVGYWLLVARVAPAGIVGTSAALYTSIQFAAYLTALGLPIAVARYGASSRNIPSILFNWSIVLTVASSFLGAALYLRV